MNAVLAVLFRWFCASTHRRFLKACRSPRFTQLDLLAQILSEAALTERGQSLNLKPMDYPQFQKTVPLSDYDGTYAIWIEKQKTKLNESVLAPGGIKTFEKTSGSSGKFKLIPYNAAILRSFENYFRIWCYDLLTKGPKLSSYLTYMSVSPQVQEDHLSFSDDSEYLQSPLRYLLKPFMAVPLDVKTIRDPNAFRRVVATLLTSCADLEAISIWHPSFFTLLLKHIEENRKAIAKSLREGVLKEGGRIFKLRKNPKALLHLESSEKVSWKQIWPDLKIISAWDAGNSKPFAQALNLTLSPPLFQGKGLLATEAPMTLPLTGVGTIPFITEVFFEFKDKNDSLFLLDELQVGEIYQVIISQRGGLLRYQTRDQVKVRSYPLPGLPDLEFVGRTSDISDLVGEKISVQNVNELTQILRPLGVTNICLLPILSATKKIPQYILLFEASGSVSASEIADVSEKFFKETYHYHYARQLGQLDSVKAFEVADLTKRLIDFFVNKKSMKVGDIKLKNLVSQSQEASEILENLCGTKT